MSLPSAWNGGTFNNEVARENIKAFLTAMENPAKTATRGEFEQTERDLKTFVQQRLA